MVVSAFSDNPVYSRALRSYSCTILSNCFWYMDWLRKTKNNRASYCEDNKIRNVIYY